MVSGNTGELKTGQAPEKLHLCTQHLLGFSETEQKETREGLPVWGWGGSISRPVQAACFPVSVVCREASALLAVVHRWLRGFVGVQSTGTCLFEHVQGRPGVLLW